MKLFDRIERKLLQIRCRSIYLRHTINQPKRYSLEKGLITIFHDYERHYHDDTISEYSDKGIRQILEIEKVHGVKATYNIVARLINEVQPIVQDIRKNDHEIASHSYCHSIISKMTPDEINRDILLSKALFSQNGLELKGLRCPQSKWSFKQLPIMLRHGMAWSAENDKAELPYSIFRKGKQAIIRMPIIMDDWSYEESNISPNEMYQELINCAQKIAENKIYGAIGFHPWVQGKDNDRIKVFYEFISYISKQNKISILSFSQAYDFFSRQQSYL